MHVMHLWFTLPQIAWLALRLAVEAWPGAPASPWGTLNHSRDGNDPVDDLAWLALAKGDSSMVNDANEMMDGKVPWQVHGESLVRGANNAEIRLLMTLDHFSHQSASFLGR